MLLHLVFLLFLCLNLGIDVESARVPATVFLIRHGEKPADPDDNGLAPAGFKRAQCLREAFGVGSGYDIGHIMAPSVKRSECAHLHILYIWIDHISI